MLLLLVLESICISKAYLKLSKLCLKGFLIRKDVSIRLPCISLYCSIYSSLGNFRNHSAIIVLSLEKSNGEEWSIRFCIFLLKFCKEVYMVQRRPPQLYP